MTTKTLIHTPAIQKAVRFAIKTHEVYQKQKRKGKDIPYVTHPLTVGLILAHAGANEAMIIAGILHDTVEDSVDEKKVTIEMIEEKFGVEVAALVESVTETNKNLPWNERKKLALEHIESFSQDSVLVKSADVISNVTEILADYEAVGEELFKRFNASREETLANYIRVASALLHKWPESPLAGDLQEIINFLCKLYEAPPEPHARTAYALVVIEQNLSYMADHLHEVGVSTELTTEASRLISKYRAAVANVRNHLSSLAEESGIVIVDSLVDNNQVEGTALEKIARMKEALSTNNQTFHVFITHLEEKEILSQKARGLYILMTESMGNVLDACTTIFDSLAKIEKQRGPDDRR